MFTTVDEKRPLYTFLMHSDDNDISGGKKSHLQIAIPDEQLPEGERFIKMDLCRLPRTIFTISAARGNNTFRMSVVDPASWVVFTIPDGAYNFLSLEQAIYSLFDLVSPTAWYEDASSGKLADRIYPASFSVNDSTGKGVILVRDFNNGTQYYFEDYHIDLTNNGASTFYQVLGFTATDNDLKLPDRTSSSFISTNSTDYYQNTSTVYFRSPQIWGKYRNTTTGGEGYSDIFHTANWRANNWDYQTEPRIGDKVIARLRSNYLNIFEVRLTDKDNNLFTFNGDSESDAILFDFTIY